MSLSVSLSVSVSVSVSVYLCLCLCLCLSCLGGHLQIHGDTEPSPVVLGEQATMEKTTQRFQKIATTLADLNAEGLNVQTVNDIYSSCTLVLPVSTSSA